MSVYTIEAEISRYGRRSGEYRITARYYGDRTERDEAVGHPTANIVSEICLLAPSFIPLELVEEMAKEIKQKFERTPYKSGGVTISVTKSESQAR